MNAAVFPEPSALTLCVTVGSGLDLVDRLVKGNSSVERSDDFLVADGLGGGYAISKTPFKQ